MKRPKKKPTPLTQRVLASLARHGSGTTDAIARRVKARARATSHALSGLKRQKKAHYVVREGEPVWRKGAPKQRAKRKT